MVRFRIKHLMFLTFWTAILLAFRVEFVESWPLIADFGCWASSLAGLGLFGGLFGVAAGMRPGRRQEALFTLLFNLLLGDAILFLFTTLGVTAAG